MKKSLILLIIGAVIALSLFFFIKAWLSTKPEYRFGADRAAVIKEIELLSRLETASFTIDKIIEAGTDYDNLRQFLFGDKLLLIANGKVIAGFDLSTMQTQDFSGSGASIAINLPAPKIFDVILDNSQTKVFDRDQGLLTKGNINLEAEARQQAETAIREAACQGGILEEASKNAKQQIEVILRSAGFDNITIVIPAGSCN
ncbi:MAG: DUF4230 domain-containing protein [Patescibacteria group bacterium]|nr:DUF4230 domain-containing protein [Patescibacteria group bacterium]